MTLALLITAVGGAWADKGTLLTTINASSDFTNGSKTFDNIVTVTLYGVYYDANYGWYYPGSPSPVVVAPVNGVTVTGYVLYFSATDPLEYEGSSFEVALEGNRVLADDISTQLGSVGITKIEVYGTAAPDVEVTTNKAQGETTFTEASFQMPAFDATADYELVRDMSIQMTATMGDGTDGVRYRVKKAQQGEGYEPADLSMMQVLALVAVNDGIEQKALTLDQDYFCRIYKLDEQTLQPTGDGVKLNDFDFAPGLYALKAFAKDGSDYDGETALSNTFKLFQGYEVEVAAKEFITYYKDEALYVEDEAAELYTISSVNGDQAVLSDRSDAMPSNTPMLVYNKSNETKVILLIPCAEPDMAITVAPEFQGTLTGTTIAASTEGQTNYAFNGKQFVFVKNAIEVGPNKAWLSINTGEPSARITIVFDSEATGIKTTDCTDYTDSVWYDLNGRKVNAPSKKGIYIMNGRKVVVK